MNSRQRSNRKLIMFFGGVFLLGLLFSLFIPGLFIRGVAPVWRLSKPNIELLPGEYFVLSHPPKTPYDTLIIDGHAEIGAKVLMPEGPILGTVMDAFSKQSKVKLFSSPGEKTEAVLERSDTPVELVGLGFGNFLILVPREIVVISGDRVLSSGREAALLAVVGKVEGSPTDAFKEVRAVSPINIFSIRKVLVP